VRTRLPLALLAALLLTTVLSAAGPAHAASSWTHRLSVDLSARDLGLPAGAGPSVVAGEALQRLAPRLGLPKSLSGIRLEENRPLAGGTARLRFQQTAHGRRIAWSQIDVMLSKGRVRSVSATVVPVKADRLAGRQRISPKRAMAIARSAVPGPEDTRAPELIAYAGRPTTRGSHKRVPRLAYVIETLPESRGRAALRSQLGGESPTPVCLIVDARTGRVLTTWDGIADVPATPVPASSPPPASVAPPPPPPGSTTLAEIWDNSVQPAALYARVDTTADPFDSTSWITTGTRAKASIAYFRQRTLTMDALVANVLEVGKYVCTIDHYCGRYGSRVYGFSPWRVFGLGPTRSETSPITFDVFINQADITNEVPNDAERNDLVAHEFGHVMDWVYAGDRLRTDEGDEVQEALADMFAYDADSRDATFGEDTLSGASRNWANPGALTHPTERLPYPAAMSQYKCGAEEHFNGTILSHAFYLFRQRVSTNTSVAHSVSGRVLQQVPAFLAPQARFFDVKQGFIQLAGQLYPAGQQALIPNAQLAAQQAFADAGGPTDPGSRCGPN
jgi:Thermolysin metallopeptidase, alpha-helical domain